MESPETVHLLDEEPALAELLTAHERPAARRALTASAYYAKSGSWSPDAFNQGEERPFGLLVLEGLVLREVVVAATTCGELVGPGELLRPWADTSQRTPTPYEIGWKVVQPLRVAVLDPDFARVLAMWPPLVDAFVDRAVERSHSLALHVAIHCLRRVDLSLMVLFSHLGDRFGRMTMEGIVIPIDLTHRDLGKLVGATRQSISTALAELADKEYLARRHDGGWLMQTDAPEELERMLSHRRRSRDPA